MKLTVEEGYLLREKGYNLEGSRIDGSSLHTNFSNANESTNNSDKYSSSIYLNRSFNNENIDQAKFFHATSGMSLHISVDKAEQAFDGSELKGTNVSSEDTTSPPNIVHANPDFLPLVHRDNILWVNDMPYVKLGIIGKGGSCKVFRALSKDCKIVAIKKVKLAGITKKLIEGYTNEIYLLKRLRGNPAIIQMYDSEVDPERKGIFLVMEAGEVDLNHVASTFFLIITVYIHYISCLNKNKA